MVLERHTGHSHLAGAARGVVRQLLRASCALGMPTERVLCLVPSDATGWQKMDFCSTVHGNCGVEQAGLWGWWNPIPGKSEVLGHWSPWDLVPGCLQCPLREDVSGTLSSQALLPLS